MHILGISCFYHDAAAALLRDGILIAAAEEERFTRKKHDSDFPEKAIEFCLRRGGITAADLDYIVFYEKPFVKFERIIFTSMQTFPKSAGLFREAMKNWLLDKLWIKGLIKQKTERRRRQDIVLGTPPVACRERFFLLPLRRGRYPHGGWRRRMGHRFHGYRKKQRAAHHPGGSLPSFFGSSLQRLHRFSRL